MSEKKVSVFNPHDKEIGSLPVIYGFNNGGSPGLYSAQLIAEDGRGLGGHACSSEGFMSCDLGILEGTRPDRHETLKKHYPNGYRMEFVGYNDVRKNKHLMEAIELNKKAGDDKNASKTVVEIVKDSQ